MMKRTLVLLAKTGLWQSGAAQCRGGTWREGARGEGPALPQCQGQIAKCGPLGAHLA